VSAVGGGFQQPRLAGATWAGNFDDARGRLGLVEQFFKLTSAMRATQPLMTSRCDGSTPLTKQQTWSMAFIVWLMPNHRESASV
jgi:hypothetical protein